MAEVDVLRAGLAAEQAARHRAEARLAELEAQADQLAIERRDAVRNLKDTETRVVERGTQLNAARARIRALEAELRAASPPAESGETPAPAPEAPSPTASSVPETPPVGSGAGSGSPLPVAVPAVVVTGVAHAAAAAASLADALAGVAEALEQAREDARAAPAASVETATGATARTAAGAEGPAAGVDAAGAAPLRVPLALPGGVFDDSVEAAEHLLRAPGAVLVVDGYNVTMTGWPELPAAEQRRRLVAAASDLAHRTATAVELVFDGAEVEPLSVPAPMRSLVRVRFSEPGVEADDVIIDMVGRIPAATPVIVASSDNRVRAAVRRRGANVLHARQLVTLLRR